MQSFNHDNYILCNFRSCRRIAVTVNKFVCQPDWDMKGYLNHRNGLEK